MTPIVLDGRYNGVVSFFLVQAWTLEFVSSSEYSVYGMFYGTVKIDTVRKWFLINGEIICLVMHRQYRTAQT